MRVFFDTNIILDLLLERPGFEVSAKDLQLQEEGRISACVSILTMINAAYVYRKTVGQSQATANLKYLSALFEVLPMDSEMMNSALYLDGKDYEDVIQAVCAAAGHCDAIVTHNKKDFRINKGLAAGMDIPKVFTPAELLEELL